MKTSQVEEGERRRGGERAVLKKVVHCCSVLDSVGQCCTVFDSVVQCCTVFDSVVQNEQYLTVFYNVVQSGIVLQRVNSVYDLLLVTLALHTCAATEK